MGMRPWGLQGLEPPAGLPEKICLLREMGALVLELLDLVVVLDPASEDLDGDEVTYTYAWALGAEPSDASVSAQQVSTDMVTLSFRPKGSHNSTTVAVLAPKPTAYSRR